MPEAASNAGALAAIIDLQSAGAPTAAARAVDVAIRYDGAIVILTEAGDLLVQGPGRFQLIETPGRVRSFTLAGDGRIVVVLRSGPVYERIASTRNFATNHTLGGPGYVWRLVPLTE